jgi:hypothetical protein
MGFEVVVRPAVFPNIRPASPRVLMPEDNPTQDIAVIGGSSGKFVGTSLSWSTSLSRQNPYQEAARQFTKERVHQVDDKGNVNKKNYVDVERVQKIRLQTIDGPLRFVYEDPPPRENIETLARDLARASRVSE